MSHSKEERMIQKGKNYFDTKRAEMRDQKIKDQPFFICDRLTEVLEECLNELEKLDIEQSAQLVLVKNQGKILFERVNSILSKFDEVIEGNTTLKYKAEIEECEKEKEALMIAIKKAEEILAKHVAGHRKLRDQANLTKKQLLQSRYRERYKSLFRNHIEKLAMSMGMVVYSGDTSLKDQSTVPLKDKFKDLTELVKELIIPCLLYTSPSPRD